jgi:hypothetical protein
MSTNSTDTILSGLQGMAERMAANKAAINTGTMADSGTLDVSNLLLTAVLKVKCYICIYLYVTGYQVTSVRMLLLPVVTLWVTALTVTVLLYLL